MAIAIALDEMVAPVTASTSTLIAMESPTALPTNCLRKRFSRISPPYPSRYAMISVRTTSPQQFYEGLPAVVLETNVRLWEMGSQDDNLQAVFNYLVARD